MSTHAFQNTLYVTAQGAYVRRERETILVEVEDEERLKLPVHHVSTVMLFGRVMMSPGFVELCAEKGVAVSLLSPWGRFRGRLVRPQSGNIHLRLAQFRAAEEPSTRTSIARQVVRGKLANTRNAVLRSARDADADDAKPLRETAAHLRGLIGTAERTDDLDEIRGIEGEGAKAYFATITHMILKNRQTFEWNGRSRRPPRDSVNALLSFLYAVLLGDCSAALESVGLDPQLGYLHTVRSGRPALALDLEEEFRPIFAERLALTLINRGQVDETSFEDREGGAVNLTEEGRRTVLEAYQKLKDREVTHELLDRRMPLGLVPYTQARLLARHVRGDLEDYPPFVHR